MKFEKISWKTYEKECINLAEKLKEQDIDIIVAISRGGLVAARIFSDLLKLSVSHITVASYQDLKQKKEIKITETPNRLFDNHNILLVDEVADTGKTFIRAIEYFKKFKKCNVITLALYIKSHTSPLPDYWAKKIDKWIIYPYELNETYHAFLKEFKTMKKAKQKLLEVGFYKWEINNL